MIRHGVAAMLAADGGITCVGEASDGLEALKVAPSLQPDVLVMDISLPRMDGFEAIGMLRTLLPKARFIVLTVSNDPEHMRQALASGAVAYLLKSSSAPDLAQAVRDAHAGRDVLTEQLGALPLPSASSSAPQVGGDLTQRERELLALMARGMSNQEISTHLSIAMPTVKFHVTNILSKLHADNRTEAVLIALRHKLVLLQ